jgi:hypothetical protein
LDDRFHASTLQILRKLGYEFGEANNVKHPFDKSSKMAGKDCAYRFLKTHNLSLIIPQQTSIWRVMGFSTVQVNKFFQDLTELYKKYKFPPSAIFNIDESGLSTVPNKVPEVVTAKGKKVVGKVSSGERGENITVVCAMSASGFHVPPAVVFARKRMIDELLAGAPPETIAMCFDLGYITSALFVEWIHHFQEKVKVDTEHPVLLLLDKYTAHLSLEAINFCREHSIHLITLPPHSSHKMQPLDKYFFKPLELC